MPEEIEQPGSEYGAYQQNLAQEYDPYNFEGQNNPPEAQEVVEPDDTFLLENKDLFPIDEEEGITVYQFLPEISDMGAYLFNTYDVSFNTLLYLSSLGYPYAQWQISFYRGQILYDICDVYNGRYFPLTTLLDDARAHAAGGATPGNWKGHPAYYPPAPIFSQTHVGCRCSLVCLRPRTYQEIPDTAPGIPLSGNRHLIVDAKKRLLNSLKDEYVNAHTFLDPEKAKQISLLTLPEEMNQLANVKKYKTNMDFSPDAFKYQRNRHVRRWDPTYKSPAAPDPASSSLAVPGLQNDLRPLENIYTPNEYDVPIEPSEASIKRELYKYAAVNRTTPVEMIESIMYASPSGLLTPLPQGYRGFLLEAGAEMSKVYLVQLNHIIELPNDSFQEVPLRLSRVDRQHTYGGVYIYVDDMLGITFKVFGKPGQIKFALAYIPELGSLVEIQNWKILERN